MIRHGEPNYDNLVKMANQISQFFESQSGIDVSAGIEEHIRKFWDPRMRRQIVEYAGKGGTGLREAAARAVQGLSAP